jgi:hypothetical protein
MLSLAEVALDVNLTLPSNATTNSTQNSTNTSSTAVVVTAADRLK